MPHPEFEPTIPIALKHAVARFAERDFLLLGDRRMTYREAEAESARLARGLLARGVGKGTRVGILFPNGPGWATAFFAAARIGALAVPINTFSKAGELAWILRHADVHTLLTTPALLSHDYQERLEECAPSLASQSARAGALFCPELPHLRQVFVDGDDVRPWAGSVAELEASAESVSEDLLAAAEACVVPADWLSVIYSSGSTAEPKGAIHSHGAMVRQASYLEDYRDPVENGVIWTPMPFFWVGGLLIGLLQSMLQGWLVLCQEVFEPGATLKLLQRERATAAFGWPQYTQAMLDHPDFPTTDLSSLGEAGSMNSLVPPEDRPRDPELRSNSLGMTETCGPHTYGRMDVDLPERLRGSFGKGLPGVEHKIIDPDTGEIRKTGEHGEICVRSPRMMQGMYKREREDVFDEDGYYHTGDGGHLNEEGHLFFKARLGEMIKTGGANVTPREVELSLEAMDDVQSAFVVGVPHPSRGQNVTAAVVKNEGATVTAEELRLRLRDELSAYKVPRHVHFFSRDELPFTDSGKVTKPALIELMIERIAAEEAG